MISMDNNHLELNHVIQVPSPQGIRIAAQSFDIDAEISNLGGSAQHFLTPAYSPIDISDFWEVYSLQYFLSKNYVFTYQQLTLDSSNRASSQSHIAIISSDQINKINLFSLSQLMKEDGQGNKLSTYKKSSNIETLNKLSISIADIILDKPMLSSNDLINISNNILQNKKSCVNLKKNQIGSDYKNRSDICKNSTFIIFHLLLSLNKSISFITYSPNQSILDRYDLLLTYTSKYAPLNFNELILDQAKPSSDSDKQLSNLLINLQNNDWNLTQTLQLNGD